MRCFVLCASLSIGLLACGVSSSPITGSSSGGSSDGGSSGAGGDAGSSADGGGLKAAALAISAPASAMLAQGGTATVSVTVTRTNWDGPVALAVSGLPAGLSAGVVNVAAGDNTGDLTIAASASATGSGGATITATGDGLSATASISISIGTQSLDPTFGTAGILTINPPVSPVDFVITKNNGVIIASPYQRPTDFSDSFELVGFDSFGKIDTTFGTAGTTIFTTPTTVGSQYPYAIALQPDGKILVASGIEVEVGYVYQVGLTRFTPTGAVDASFGTAGTATFTFPGCTTTVAATGLAIQSDGSILESAKMTCGTAPSTTSEGGVVRFTSTGAIDTTFGSNGALVQVGASGVGVTTDHIAIDGADLLVLGKNIYPTHTDATITRFSPGNIVDTTFATGGVYTMTGTDTNAMAFSPLVLQSGNYLLGMNNEPMFERLTSAGMLDTTFGVAGIVGQDEVFDGDWDDDDVTVLVPTANSNLLLVQSNIPKQALEVWSYSANGVRDMTYAGGGRILTPLGMGAEAMSGKLSPDGRLIVLSGPNNPGLGASSQLVRFFP